MLGIEKRMDHARRSDLNSSRSLIMHKLVPRDDYERNVGLTPDQSANDEMRMVAKEKDVVERTTESMKKISDHFSTKSQDRKYNTIAGTPTLTSAIFSTLC